MPFDAGFAAAVTKELSQAVCGAKIEKIQQPERDEIILCLKKARETLKLLISAKAGSSRCCITRLEKENPQSPPMFCMLLRKHLSGGVISSVTQLGFERALEFKISTYNELGFPTEKYIIFETTGRYSNIIFCDNQKNVVSALRLSELSAEGDRKLICGFRYEPMPLPDGKKTPVGVSKEEFLSDISAFISQNDGEYPCEKYFLTRYYGMSPVMSREIVYRTAKNTSAKLCEIVSEKLESNLYINFQAIYKPVENGNFAPYLLKNKNGEVIDFSFCEILQYGSLMSLVKLESFSVLLDTYFGQRDKRDRMRQKSHDILKLVTASHSRILKKTEIQREDYAACAGKDRFKKLGDLITSNIYLLKKGMTKATVVDYNDESMPQIEIPLEINLTPSQNAQKYYKKYNKMKTAEQYLVKQIEQSEKELAYMDTVFESLTKAQNENDLEEIREELRAGGYGKKLDSLSSSRSAKKNAKHQKKTYSPMRFVTSGGYEVLCGKNNLQNEFVTFSASKNDYWFHVKNMPGSHTVMLCGDDEPDAKDFTECAMIAAYYSSGKNIPNVAVDYTKIRNIRKPSGAKPGFVIYDTNYSAYVTADEELVLSLKKS